MGKRKKKDDNLLGTYTSGGVRQMVNNDGPKVTKKELFAPNKEKLISEDEEIISAKEEDPEYGKHLEECVRHIWNAIEDNKIFLGFAAVNYDFRSGYPIYDYDTIIDLLINYGYTSDVAVIFVKELSESTWSDGTRRVVTISSHKSDIYSNVERLKDNPCD